MSLKTLSEHFCAEWPSGQKFQQKHDKFFNQLKLICPIIDCSANFSDNLEYVENNFEID